MSDIHKILFSGTFDPFHDGHKSIVDTLLDKTYSNIVISPVMSKWKPDEGSWTQSSTLFSFEERCQMISDLYVTNDRVFVNDIEKDGTMSIYEILVRTGIRSIVVGSDNIEKIPTWRNFDHYDDVLDSLFVFPRNVFNTPDKLKRFQLLFFWEHNSRESSSDIRERGIQEKYWDLVKYSTPDPIYEFVISKYKKDKLWVDDTRTPPNDDWDWAKDYETAITYLENQLYTVISLDHDLGDFDEDGEEYTGYDILLKIVDSKYNNTDIKVPSKIKVHSANVVGHERMQQTINRHFENE